MSEFLNYSELDTTIQQRMKNSAPASNVRLMAINDAANNLYTVYDIESAIRSAMAYLIPNGRAINISNLVSDFKSAKDLRYLAQNKHNEEFIWRDSDLFAIHLGEGKKLNEYSVSYRNGKIYLELNSSSGVISKELHNMSSLTDYGTWTPDTVNSDAKTVAEDSVTILENNISLQVDIDVSQSANDYALIENDAITEIDLTDYENLGRFQFWIYIPDVTGLTNIELRWGNDNTAYWYGVATTQSDGSPLASGWNYIEIDWADAVEIGTVDVTTVDYLAVKINYGATFIDQKIRIEKIDIYLPMAMKLEYFTYFISKDSSGTYQEEMTETANDELLIPRRYKNLIVLDAMKTLIPIAFGDDGKTFLALISNEYKSELKKLGLDIGKSIKGNENKFKLRKQW